MLKNTNQKHISVLLHELVDSLEVSNNKKNIIVDCTLGFWGHAKSVIEKMNPWDTFLAFDADKRNLLLAKENIESTIKEKKVEAFLINNNFSFLKEELEARNIWEVSFIYYDLGISSMHIDEAERGFSFRYEWPLDMRFDTSKWKSAYDIINFYKEKELETIFREYWEERFSHKIASLIIKKRKEKKITTTKELAQIIDLASKDTKTKARIFQAIRIEVNGELESIKRSLRDAIDFLRPWGRIFVISFHSLEDRIVKNILREATKDCICNELICNCKNIKKLKILTKKPIIPSKEEQENNPRARSAKARIAEKI